MVKTKYIVFEIPESGIEDIVIFSGLVQHDWVARGLGLIVSAGFIDIYTDFGGEMFVECHGESISLGVKSRPQGADSKIARRALGMEPY